jgi:ATP synthase I chain
MTGEAVPAASWPSPRFFRLATILGLLGASALAALGRFHAAAALTLGAAVAIVSALWLSDLVGRFKAPAPGAPARFDWKFGLKAVLRYAFVGLALWGASRMLPADVPWVVVGLSTVVAAVVIDGLRDLLAGRRSRTGAAQ